MVSWCDVRRDLALIRWSRAVEAVVFLAVWCAAGVSAFEPDTTFHPLDPQTYMLVGLLAWPALRFGQRGVTVSLIVLAAVAVTSRAVNAGPLPCSGASMVERLLALQVCLGFTGATGLLLAATYAEAQASERSAHESHAQLQALGDNLPNGMVYQLMRKPNGETQFLW